MKKNRIRLTESQLHRVIKESVKRMINEAIDEFKNASTERFNTDPTYRNMIDVNGIEDEDEFLNAIDNHQFNPNYARENEYNDVADKWEERSKKYPEGFVRDQFGTWIDDRGDDIYESRRKNKVRLTESDLHKIVKESVNRVLMESQFMSDEDITSQQKDIIITYFDIKPLMNSDGWKGTFELEFPNSDNADYDGTMVNDFIVYDMVGNRIAWDHWMPDEQTKYLQNIIRQEIAKRNR